MFLVAFVRGKGSWYGLAIAQWRRIQQRREIMEQKFERRLLLPWQSRCMGNLLSLPQFINA